MVSTSSSPLKGTAPLGHRLHPVNLNPPLTNLRVVNPQPERDGLHRLPLFEGSDGGVANLSSGRVSRTTLRQAAKSVAPIPKSSRSELFFPELVDVTPWHTCAFRNHGGRVVGRKRRKNLFELFRGHVPILPPGRTAATA